MITYEEFKKIFEFIPFEPEFEFYFNNTAETYMLIKYENGVEFSRCGYSDEMISQGWDPKYRGSEPESFVNLDDLYVAKVVDGICLEEEWKNIVAILVNSSFELPEEIDEIYSTYKNLIDKR